MVKVGYTGVSLPTETTDMLDQIVEAVKNETGIELNYPGAIKYMAKTMLDAKAKVAHE